MKGFCIPLSVLAVVLLGSCADETPFVVDSEDIVVQAYMHAEKPVEDIRLTSTLPLDSDGTVVLPVVDAGVVLIRKDVRYELEATGGNEGYYHYPGEDLSIDVDDVFQIEIAFEDRLITASTSVPPKPEGLSSSADTVWIPEFTGRIDPALMRERSLTISWSNETRDLFSLVLDNIEDDPEELGTTMPRMPQRFISQPISRDSYPITLRLFTHFGRHRLILYRINQEYADLYESREQDSRDLNEPLSNVSNGLGIFTAFSSDTLYFEVVKE